MQPALYKGAIDCSEHNRTAHFCPLNALVYIFDETPATNPPIASFVIGPSFFRIPGFA
jgi:hypothetical protein